MIFALLESFLATGLTVVFGVLWLRAQRAQEAAEKDRDRYWDMCQDAAVLIAAASPPAGNLPPDDVERLVKLLRGERP